MSEKKPNIRTVRQVPENDPTIVAFKRETQHQKVRQNFFFGRRREKQRAMERLRGELAGIEEKAGGADKLTQDSDYKRKKGSLMEAEEGEKFENVQREWMDKLGFFYHLLTEVKIPPHIKAYYARVVTEVFQKPMGAEQIRAAYETTSLGKVSREKVLELADRYTDLLEDEEKLFAQSVEKVKADFKNRLQQAVQSGWLPSSALDALHRLNTVKTVVEEAFTTQSRGYEAVSEAFGVVAVSAYLLEPERREELEGVISHEFLHEIGGVGFTYTQDTVRGDIGGQARYKTGVQSSTGGRLANEAITMLLNRKLGYQDNGYPGLLDRFAPLLQDAGASRGVNEPILFDAYFEQWAEKDGEKINPAKSAYRRLVDEVNRVYKERYNDPVGWLSFERGMTQEEYMKALKQSKSATP